MKDKQQTRKVMLQLISHILLNVSGLIALDDVAFKKLTISFLAKRFAFEGML